MIGIRRLFAVVLRVGLVAAVQCAACAGAPDRASWPRFRGPNGSGVAESGALPVHFGPETNLVWRAPLPSGHSSPCVFDDRIFLTGFSEEMLRVLCVRRNDGTVLWEKSLTPGVMEKGSRHSHPATSTPATDGRRVYAYFASKGLIAYDFSGREVWRRELPTPVTQHGASSSPVVWADTLYLACDQDVASYLLAVDTNTGETVWRADRPQYRRGFSTPVLWPGEAPRALIVAGTLRLAAYGLRDGEPLWEIGGLPNEMVSSPVAGEEMIFAGGWTYGSGVRRMPEFDSLLRQGDANGDQALTLEEAPSGPAQQHFRYIDGDKDGRIVKEEWESLAAIFDASRNALLGVRPTSSEDGPGAEVVWERTRGLPYVPSPLYYDGRVYLVKNGGLASCFEARTGEVNYEQERLGALGDYYSSPVAAGGRICVISQPGVAVVFRAGPKLEVLARNRLEGPVLATPAVVESTLYVRTEEALSAFREPPAD